MAAQGVGKKCAGCKYCLHQAEQVLPRVSFASPPPFYRITQTSRNSRISGCLRSLTVFETALTKQVYSHFIRLSMACLFKFFRLLAISDKVQQLTARRFAGARRRLEADLLL